MPREGTMIIKVVTAAGIVLFVAGIAAALAIPFSHDITKALNPGPTVKSHGDAYGQAFAVLFCWIALAAAALLASLLAWIASMYIGLSAGIKWLCWFPTPLAAVTSLLFWLRLTG